MFELSLKYIKVINHFNSVKLDKIDLHQSATELIPLVVLMIFVTAQFRHVLIE